MIIDFNEFLMALSYALDLSKLESGIKMNHSKRVCYISLKICDYLGFSYEEKLDAYSIMLLHHTKTENGEWINLLKSRKITFNNDKFRILQEILKFSCFIDNYFNLENGHCSLSPKILNIKNEPAFSAIDKLIFDAFFIVSQNKDFWLALHNRNINKSLKKIFIRDRTDISSSGIIGIMRMFSDIIDAKSRYTEKHSNDLTKKLEFLAKHFSIKDEELSQLIVASSLHDIGKLAVPSFILHKPDTLSNNEYKIIKMHPYFTRAILSQISNFKDITEWASNHHEKLNGKGYPLGIESSDLDFNSRLIACLDIYQALTEDRPYRKQHSHRRAMEIMMSMHNNGEIDGEIVKLINYAFA